MTPFVGRVIRASKLDVHVYEEFKADKSAMSHCDYSSEWLRTGSEPLIGLPFLEMANEKSSMAESR